MSDDNDGAVRTSVTLLGQNIGNTMSIIVYTFCVSFAVLFGWIAATCLRFIQAGIRPNKTARGHIHLPEQ